MRDNFTGEKRGRFSPTRLMVVGIILAVLAGKLGAMVFDPDHEWTHAVAKNISDIWDDVPPSG
ncbi:hypothetical protein [Aureimonas mangrovi]|uniref:hypothetical protein n=1 Tax=Aureimonas mangrovi TaxID=2758041 RepID=UPI00163DD1B8|nr:hypothetical protein [Aureimonas mangrovi]